MPRWRSIWLVARREILERGRSRGFILSVAFTTLIVVGSFVIPAIVFGGDNPTKVGVVEPSPPGLQAAIEQSAQRFDHKVAITTYPDAAAADAALNDGSAEIVIDMPADLSGPGEIRVKRQPDQATAQVIAAATVALRVQAVLGGSNVDQAALADAQRPPETTSLQAADRAGPGEVPGRQHRGGPDPRRHLQLRLHGPDRRGRGEAEPGRRGRPLDGPRP